MDYQRFFDYLKEKVKCENNTWHPSPSVNKNCFASRRHFAFDENIRFRKKGSKWLFNPHIFVYEAKTELFDGTKDVFEELAGAAFSAARDFLGEGAHFEDYFKFGGKPDANGHLYGVVAQLFIPISSDNFDALSQQEKDEIVRAYKVLVDAETFIGVSVEDFNKRAQGGSKAVEIKGFAYNLIVFGAPGTGKSRYLECLRGKKKKEVIDGNDTEELFFKSFERVTFYPTYSYAQFVGSYKPVMKDVDKDGFAPKNGEPTRKAIVYEFVPGPFLRILKDALRNENEDKNYLLIIEEINRANAAAVFGDVFQLLDRKDGASEYSITPSCEIVEYLMRKDEDGDGIKEDKARELKIPSNMYIWATMNSADQGVFPLDTAFKRRWDFEYMSLDKNTSNDNCDVSVGRECTCKWGKLRKVINDILKRNHVNEDKLLSSSFVRSDKNTVISLGQFTMKVLMYLWEDAARMYRKNVFADGLGALSDLMDAWEKLTPDKESGTVNLTKVFKSSEKVAVKMNEQKDENAQETVSSPENAQLEGEGTTESTETSREYDDVNQPADDNADDESNRGEQSDQNDDLVSSERSNATLEDSDTVKS